MRIHINLRVKYSAMTDTAQMGLSKYDGIFADQILLKITFWHGRVSETNRRLQK